MTQRSSARRGLGPRGLLLILLALALLALAAYVLSRPPMPVGTADVMPTTAPASAAFAETPSPATAGGFEAGVVAPAPATEAVAAAPRAAPSRTPARRAALTATATRDLASAATSTRRPTATRKPTATPRPTSRSGLPTIAYERLPVEARETIGLIEQDGPFPYRQDGATFQNREGLLPRKPRGYYREYTVETPGSPDRGARRIIAGEGGELYYTADHYASFREVVRP